MNPFEDLAVKAASTGEATSSNPFTEESFLDEDVDPVDPAHIDGDAPAEASWQYLGNLPYRRVPIYTNVSWSTKQVGSGLASYPVTALQNQQERFADPRSILSKTTVTKCVGCPNGGPLALITLPLTTASSGFTVTELRILTNAGKPLALLDFPPAFLGHEYGAADVMTLGFTSRCTLVVVFRDSLCITLNLSGEPILPPFHLFPDKSQLQHADVFCGGVAALAADSKECCIAELMDQHDNDAASYYAPHARRVSADKQYAVITALVSSSIHATGNRNLQYCAMAVLPRERTLHRHPEIFLSTSDRSVVVIDAGKDTLVDLQCGLTAPIVDMTFAPNGRFLACFTEAAVLTVVSTSFDTKVLDFDTSEGSTSPPLAMEWCGEDSVVLHWKNLGILMVGPYGDWLRFPYTCNTLCCVPELDCCRVVTDSTVEILQRVPAATAQLLRIGSIETTAMLLDASDAYAAGQPTDDAVAAMLENGGLDEAVATCTDAATKEFDIGLQKRLLRAASYGMHFGFKQQADTSLVGGPLEGSEPGEALLPSKTTAQFVAAARKLRILNALRHPDTGFVLTAAQYDSMSPTGVVARLVAMQRPALAAYIARFLGLPKSVQLYARAQQAAAFVLSESELSDAEIAERAIEIINADEPASWNRGGFATVALAAAPSKPAVANLLLLLETSVADKVPALIATGSYADAIAVATTARDSDFIFSTLMEYEQSVMLPATDPARAQSTMLSTVVSKFTPEAFHMLRRYFQAKGDIKSLTALLLKSQRSVDAGSAMALRGLGESDPREMRGMLTEASRIFGLGKETAFHKSSTDDYLELLKDQETLRGKYGSEAVPTTSSVASTISSVLKFAATPDGSREQHRLLHDAEKLCRKFRMSDKRFWHIRVKAFAESEQWSNLRSLVENRKPPIGFKPFARAAIKGKRPASEIMRYIDPITSMEEKYDLLCEAAMWKEALAIAENLKDIRRVLNVKSLCNNPSLQLQAEEIMGRLA